ncbi:maleylpyruvate isomerase family mycothiol-dependent enzyme [Saccharothrix longispora]|uniref:maleylpyruvate isomerase family mycothiol-dependent enzyme n=1 Tax=Saccharothrix longispora TaxID=33920 RepID=UPI0028FDBF21|nr:maleylpyruvate isomerase family mycothiol-dependent enzyme [Saccharothrix longispora]MBY8847950.1 maleylpyruvate isomerase N-terminal domain-containing protein [Saccharothrix sp. MB29]MDU0291407.1 maleylpyruvate isomerase family mycothiol-dependent enzyme [Saccharothrix longispora]
MDHADFVKHLRTEYTALRAAAEAAGPDAPVPTCSGWTVRDLVDHLGRTHAWTLKALTTPPDGPRPDFPERPTEWRELLDWWTAAVAELADTLAGTTSNTPAWTFAGPATFGFWSRRQAHETAIHRLDAEHALHGDGVPSLLFDVEFAADGVDELLGVVSPYVSGRKPVERAGRLLFHAADAGRAWEVRLTPGEPPVVGPVTDSGTDEDFTLAGTADALYRAVWGRPSGAIASGDRSLLDSLPRP